MPHWEMVDDQMAEILRRKTPAQRLAIAFDMWNFAYQLVHSQVKATHLEWTAAQVQRETARRMSHGAV